VGRARLATNTPHAVTDWEGLINKAASPLAKQELARLQAMYNKVAADAAATKSEVAPIDYQSYRSRLSDPKIVSEFETAFKTLKYPESSLTTIKQQEAKLKDLIENAKAVSEASAVRAKELNDLVHRMTTNRTSKDTTIDEVTAMYPEIEKEVQQEQKEEQWGKGIGL
jgi:hypothetical protein